MKTFAESELILNEDGSVYHLHIHPENLADTVILVGDPGRVAQLSLFFDKIEYKQMNREIVTHTGLYKGKRMSIISTGMGTDNIDIVLTELDALANIDLKNRTEKKEHKRLNLIRLGTCGSLHADIPSDELCVSEYALGLDGLLNFYAPEKAIFESDLEDAFIEQSQWPERLARPYIVKSSEKLFNAIAPGYKHGITATACGFYGPQGREIRLPLAIKDINERLQKFNHNGHRVSNFEMETSALYGLGKALGHETLTVCLVVANRAAQTHTHLTAKGMIEKYVEIMDKIAAIA